MAQQFRIKRVIQVVPVTSNGFATIDLPRGYDYESLHCRFYGQVQVTAAATSVRAEAPTQAIKRLEVIADGRNTVHSVPYWSAVLGLFNRDIRMSGSRSVTPPTAAGIATYDVEANGVIDFQTVDGERPKDSNFRTDGLQLFQLRLTFGAALDMFVPGAGAAAFVNCFVEISSNELVELPADPTNPDSRTKPMAIKKTSFQEVNVTSSNSNLQTKLPAGNLIKSVLIRTEGLTTAGEPTTGMLNQLQLLSGVDVRVKASGAGLRGMNNADFGPVTAGYYIADVARSGASFARLSELWDVTRQAEPQVLTDVVGGATGKMQLVITEYLMQG